MLCKIHVCLFSPNHQCADLITFRFFRLILDKHSVTSNCSQTQNCCLCKMSQEELELSFPSPCNKGTICFVYEDIVIT